MIKQAPLRNKIILPKFVNVAFIAAHIILVPEMVCILFAEYRSQFPIATQATITIVTISIIYS
jgi:hypothetical protein